jgi:FtsZ-interacting cell division protein ZipA
MSDLQTALLFIGLAAIAAVYLFGWWQQKVYHRRKFGEAFKSNTHADALYQGTFDKAAEQVQQKKNGLGDMGSRIGDITSRTGSRPIVRVTQPAVAQPEVPVEEPSSAELAETDEVCAILNERSDFVVELALREPAPPSALNGLWQRKFDFGKTVQICGLTLHTKRWERVIAESQTLYSHFKIALQLVDRNGLISSAKLADFRDLVSGVAVYIKAHSTAPDMQQTMHYALELDAFCVVVDQMVGINLMPAGERLLQGTHIAQAARLNGMSLEPDGAFHLLNAQGHSLFSLINRDTKVFQRDMMEQFNTAGMTLLLDVPRVENPALQFDKMLFVARELAKTLQVNLVDDRRVQLTESGLLRIRAKISEVEAKMSEQGIAPGSAQARRLFS